MSIPIAAGFFLRLFPVGLMQRTIRSVNKNRPAMVCIHPHEVYSDSPKLKMPLIVRLEAYYGTKVQF